jgi:hypothetical protein
VRALEILADTTMISWHPIVTVPPQRRTVAAVDTLCGAQTQEASKGVLDFLHRMTTDGAYFPDGYLLPAESGALEFSGTGATRWMRPYALRPEARPEAAQAELLLRPSADLEDVPRALAAARDVIVGDSSRVEVLLGVLLVARAALPSMWPFVAAAGSGRSRTNGVVLGSALYMLLRRVFPGLPEAGARRPRAAPTAASVAPAAAAGAAANAGAPRAAGAGAGGAAAAAAAGAGGAGDSEAGPGRAPGAGMGAAAAPSAVAAAAAAGATSGPAAAAAAALRVLGRRAPGGGGPAPAAAAAAAGTSESKADRFPQAPCSNACGRVGYFVPCKCGTARYCSATCKEAHLALHAPLCVARPARQGGGGDRLRGQALAGVAAKRLLKRAQTSKRLKRPSKLLPAEEEGVGQADFRVLEQLLPERQFATGMGVMSDWLAVEEVRCAGPPLSSHPLCASWRTAPCGVGEAATDTVCVCDWRAAGAASPLAGAGGHSADAEGAAAGGGRRPCPRVSCVCGCVYLGACLCVRAHARRIVH